MVQLSKKRIAVAILRNQAHRFKIAALLRRLRRQKKLGGHAWMDRPLDANVAHIFSIFKLLHQAAGDLTGKAAMEIGPGDNVGVAYCFLKAGCTRVTVIERFPSLVIDKKLYQLLKHIDACFTEEWHGKTPSINADDVLTVNGDEYRLRTDILTIEIGSFEDKESEPTDFIYSNDVIEHVQDPTLAFQSAFRLLKPHGLFVNSIDFAGHNAFSNSDRPLDFLTCPDWLYDLMFSHVLTSNRVRFSEILTAAKANGFEIVETQIMITANDSYLKTVRPHLLSRFHALTDSDLRVIQALVVARKGSAGIPK